MTLNVGKVTYLNALPFYLPFNLGEMQTSLNFITGVPSVLNQKMRNQELDFSIISSAEYLKNKDLYHLIPPFCIASTTKAISVNLYIKEPFTFSDFENKTIFVTSESASSAELIKILFYKYWKIKPNFVSLSNFKLSHLTTLDAFLLIGDLALTHPKFNNFKTFDIANIWYEKTNLPFVFAVTVATKKAISEKSDEIIQLSQQFNKALQWSLKNMDKVEQEATKLSTLPKETLHDYYSYLDYTMNAKHQKSLNLFKQLQRETHAENILT